MKSRCFSCYFYSIFIPLSKYFRFVKNHFTQLRLYYAVSPLFYLLHSTSQFIISFFCVCKLTKKIKEFIIVVHPGTHQLSDDSIIKIFCHIKPQFYFSGTHIYVSDLSTFYCISVSQFTGPRPRSPIIWLIIPSFMKITRQSTDTATLPPRMDGR